MRRRSFLRSSLAASASLALAGGFMRSFAIPDGRLGHIAADEQYGERILVILRMFGGNDGLNTIVPMHSDEYYRVRKTEAQHDLSIAREQALPIPGVDGHGLHPSMAPLLELYEEGKVAIIQGVGYPNMDLSHFRGTDIWLSASDADVYDTSGWIGRWFDSHDQLPSHGTAPYAIEFGSVISRVLHGHHTLHGHAFTDARSAIDPTGISLASYDHNNAAVLAARCRSAHQHSATINDALLRVRDHSRPYPEPSPLSNALRYTSRLIRSGLPTQVYVVHAGQFDTHHHQQAVQAQQLDELFRNVHAFLRELEDSGDAHRVCVLPISEFGRRVEPTESGTDHGTAAPVFVIGHGVKGGMYGTPPSVEELDRNNNLLWHVDFRQIYSSIMRQWFGQEPRSVDGSVLVRHFTPLDLFHRRDSVNTELYTIAPIPVREQLTVIGRELRSVMATARVVDIQGRELLRVRVDVGAVTSIDVSEFPTGVFVLVVTTDDGREHATTFPLEHR